MPDAVTISDKDGGIQTELRAQIGAVPVYFPGTGDGRGREYWNDQIDITGSGDQTVHTVASGKRFFVDTLVLTIQSAGAAIRFKSGASDNISGVLRFPANIPLSIIHGYESQLRGKRNDQNFVINNSGDNFTSYIGGYATGYDETT